MEELRRSYPHSLSHMPQLVNWSAVMYISSCDASYLINVYKQAIQNAKQIIKQL